MKKTAVCFLFLICMASKGFSGGLCDPLPSWNEGPLKERIINFVANAAIPGNAGYIPKEERIAAFDNDGTLWSEQPLYFQLIFALDTLNSEKDKYPALKNIDIQAFLKDPRTLKNLSQKEIQELITVPAGITVEEYQEKVKQWLAHARHPRFNRPYTSLVYVPMLELIAFLKSKGFEIFIASGGDAEFMRAWVNPVYGILPQHVIGSSVKLEFSSKERTFSIYRLPEIDFIDNASGKPIGIFKAIGKRPAAAFGNSDGDLEMLQWTAAGKGPRLMLIVHHTDGVREWKYDRNSYVGRLDKALDEAQKRGWAVVDMKNDWNVIYPFELADASCLESCAK